MGRHRRQIGIGVPLRDVGRSIGELRRAFEIAAVPGDGRLDDEEEPVTRTLRSLLRMLTCPLQPAGPNRRLPPGEVVDGQSCCHGRCLRLVAHSGVGGVGPLAGSDGLLGSGEPPGGVGERFEIRRRQLGRGERAERVERIRPGLPASRIPGSFDVGDALGHELLRDPDVARPA